MQLGEYVELAIDYDTEPVASGTVVFVDTATGDFALEEPDGSVTNWVMRPDGRVTTPDGEVPL